MPFRRPFPFLLPSLFLGLCACVSHTPTKDDTPRPGTRDAAMAALQKADPCCTRFSQFSFHRELPAKPKRFDIESNLPVADFNGTRSYFLTFKLPEKHSLPYKVVLKSEMTGRWLHSSYLFAPSAVLLDADYRPMQTLDVDQCEYIGWSQSTTGALGSLTVDSPHARYLVIYSSGQQLDGSTYWEQSPTAFSADSPVKMAATGSFQIAHGPTGPLYVGVMTPRYAKAASEAICSKPDPKTSSGALSTLRSLILPSSKDTTP